MSRFKLLVATRHSPLPENDGAGAYLFDLLSFLAANGVEIEVAWLHAEDKLRRQHWWLVPARFRKTAHLTIIGSIELGPWRYFHWGLLKARAGELLNAFRLRPRARPATAASTRPAPDSAAATNAPSPKNQYNPAWSDLPTDLETRFFKKRLRRFRPDAVLVNYCWLTPLLDGLPPHIRTALLTCDVVSQRLVPSPNRHPDPGTPEGEADLLRRAQHVLAISEDDAAVFRTHLPQHSIFLAPKAAAVTKLPAAAIEPSRILFVGGMNAFNRDGLAWFLENVWPLVLNAHPAARLHICGAIGSTVATPPPQGVSIKGRVPDLTAEYAAASVVIVPLLQGSGVKIKLVEAASFGKAIVTTPIGLQGLPFLRPAVREASTPQDFAAAILQLLASESERNTLAAAVAEAVARHLSPETCYRPTHDALAAIRS